MEQADPLMLLAASIERLERFYPSTAVFPLGKACNFKPCRCGFGSA